MWSAPRFRCRVRPSARSLWLRLRQRTISTRGSRTTTFRSDSGIWGSAQVGSCGSPVRKRIHISARERGVSRANSPLFGCTGEIQQLLANQLVERALHGLASLPPANANSQIGTSSCHPSRCTVDVDDPMRSHATAAVYGSLEHGYAEHCGCLFCKNFSAQRDLVYPASFRALFERLVSSF